MNKLLHPDETNKINMQTPHVSARIVLFWGSNNSDNDTHFITVKPWFIVEKMLIRHNWLCVKNELPL